jgi:hypothetical protein
MKLPRAERADLARELIARLDVEVEVEGEDVEVAWLAEVERRMEAAERGTSKLEPWEVVHCLTSFHESWAEFDPSGKTIFEARMGMRKSNVRDPNRGRSTECPACGRLVIQLAIYQHRLNEVHEWFLVWPKSVARSQLPPEVPQEYADEYREACLVLADSPKASAALSRRCLQKLIQDKAGIRRKNLATEISELVSSGQLPSHIAESVDAIRQYGNFAAHPIEDKLTGAIVEVEPGEAEWALEVIELLLDFYLVQPARVAAKKAALNAKLVGAGKPPMK